MTLREVGCPVAQQRLSRCAWVARVHGTRAADEQADHLRAQHPVEWVRYEAERKAAAEAGAMFRKAWGPYLGWML